MGTSINIELISHGDEPASTS